MHRFPNYTQSTIDQYNADLDKIMENVRDFVILHYQTNKTNTPFWKDVAALEIPDSLKTKLERWRNNLPIEEDFSGLSKYIMFRETNFAQVLYGLNLFNREKIKEEYEMQRQEIKDFADAKILDVVKYENSLTTVGHKRFLELIRQGI
jgi:tryptophan halogenase